MDLCFCIEFIQVSYAFMSISTPKLLSLCNSIIKKLVGVDVYMSPCQVSLLLFSTSLSEQTSKQQGLKPSGSRWRWS